MPQGTLDVLLVGAKDLESSGIFSKLKAYVVITLRTQEKKSTVCKETDPEWNETFHFTVSSDVDELTLKIMDKETFSSDDLVGEATIPLQAVFTEGSVSPASYNVVNEDKEFQGEITVGLTFTPDATEEDCIRREEAYGQEDQQASYGNVSQGAGYVDNSSIPSQTVSRQQQCPGTGYEDTTASYGHDTRRGHGDTRDGCDDGDDDDSRGGYAPSRGTHGAHGRRRSSRHCEEEEEESYGGYRESSYRG